MWLLTSLLSLLFSFMLSFDQTQSWTYHTVLDGDGIFHLNWNPPKVKCGDCEIFFKVEIEAKGYFGFGFSPDGRMPGSDIVVGWIKDGKVYFQDRHANEYNVPLVDQLQDYKLMSARENDTFTVFEFSRKLDTCDGNDWIINESTARVIYAYSEEDPLSDDPFYHGENRGVKSILLLQNTFDENLDLNFTSLLQWNLRSPHVDISSSDNLYWCKIVKFPNVSEKHHIVYIKPEIQEGHEQFVHHMMFYLCVGGTPEKYEGLLDDGGHECYQPNTPVEMMSCQGVTVAWAIGGQDIVFPGHVGLPIDQDPVKYYMFEIHYSNPDLQTGIFDQSGLTFYYTPNVREFDAAIFLIGAANLPRTFIPPGQEEYIVVGHSSPECLQSAFPDSGVKPIGILLHTHMLGRGMKVRHFRGNQELVPLYDEKHYDFNYQVYRFYSEEVAILPNDLLTVECTYNSTERTNVTFGGLYTNYEMCSALILYYPAVNRYISHSAPSLDVINNVLNTSLKDEADVSRVLSSYDWTTADVDKEQSDMRNAVQEALCYHVPHPEDQEPNSVSYPNNLVPYAPKSRCNATL